MLFLETKLGQRNNLSDFPVDKTERCTCYRMYVEQTNSRVII